MSAYCTQYYYWVCPYLIGVRPVHVLSTVGGIGECFTTPIILADVRTLACVRTKMGLQVFQARVCLQATLVL